MERTLYLNETGTNISVVRDGPSLWVKEEGSSGRRIPVRLLDLVVMVHNVKIDADSLTLLAQYRVPIVLIDRRGEKLAYVLPYEKKIPSRYKDQKFVLRYERCEIRYRTWAKEKRLLISSQALKRVLRDSALSNVGVGEGNYALLIKDLLGRLDVSAEQWTCVRNTVRSLFEGLIIRRLIAWGFHIHMGVINRNKNFGLVQDLAYILDGEIDAQALQFFKSGNPKIKLELSNSGKWEIPAYAMREIIHRFENRKKPIIRIIEDIIQELCELLRQMKL